MKRCLLLLTFFLAPLTLHAAEPITVLDSGADPAPSQIMQTWLMSQAKDSFAAWEERYETLETPEQIEQYQREQKKKFVDAIGGFPERTPLNPEVTGTVEREGYTVEKVLFESRPQHYVTGLCFVPDAEKFQAPYPAVLVVCGHSANGKGYDLYQGAAALLAQNGIVGFVIDPISQGERVQHLKEDGSILVGSSTQGHTLVGLGAILLGQNTARIEIWDGMRAIDYLQQREDVEADKIGCMGNSGGGTQTAYMMSLDDRIKAASPACYITTFERLLNTIGPQDAEQNIFGQLKWGMEHSDYLMIQAPMPIMMCVATNDFFSIEGAWTSFRRGKRLFTRLGFPERISLAEVDETHGWHKPLQEAAVHWMVRWLDDRDVVVRKPELDLLSPEELQVTPEGQVLLLPDAKSVNEIQLEEFESLESEREKLWKSPEKAFEKVREIAGIRPLEKIPAPKVSEKKPTTQDGIKIEKVVLTNDAGLPLPALLYHPEGESKGRVLYTHEAGKQTSIDADGKTLSPLQYAKDGYLVLAVDPRGIGETEPDEAVWYHKRFGEDGKHLAIAYLLGRNYIGMRAEDLLVAARWLQEKADGNGEIHLVAYGEVAPAALHAAALEEQLFSKVSLYRTIPSWETIIASLTSEDQFVNCIHGATRAYDLTDLRESLGNRAKLHQPINAMREPIE